MKKNIINGVIAFVVALSAPLTLQAQGSVYLSNLDQTPAGILYVNSSSWYAAGFVTGTNAGGYMFNSVQLGMTNAIFTPSGFMAMLYTNIMPAAGGTFPANSLGTLNGSTDPATGGIYTYTLGSNLLLSPSTIYFIVLTTATPIPSAYSWNQVAANSYNPSDGWNVWGSSFHSIHGSTWSYVDNAFPQYAIDATAVPEPGVLSLLGLGGLGFLWQRRKAKTVK